MNGTAVSGWLSLAQFRPAWQIAGRAISTEMASRTSSGRTPSTGERGLYLMNGTAVTGWGLASERPDCLADRRTGDFNGDGNTDILWQNTRHREYGVYLMNGTTVTVGCVAPGPTDRLADRGTGDFNGGGQTDILWQNTSTR